MQTILSLSGLIRGQINTFVTKTQNQKLFQFIVLLMSQEMHRHQLKER